MPESIGRVGLAGQGHAEPPAPRRASQVFDDELALGLPSSLPFAAYVRQVCRRTLRPAADRDPGHAAGDGNGGTGFRTPLFEFARLVKDHPDMVDAHGVRGFRAAEAALVGLFARRDVAVEPASLWGALAGLSRDDAEADFCHSWDRAKVSPRLNPLGNAVEWNRRHPLTLDPDLRDRRPDRYAAFVSIAGWLQVVLGDRDVALPLGRLAEALAVSDRTVSTYVGMAVEDDLLRRTKGYRHRRPGEKDAAAEYRVNVGRFPELATRAGPGAAEAYGAAVHVEHAPRTGRTGASGSASAGTPAGPDRVPAPTADCGTPDQLDGVDRLGDDDPGHGVGQPDEFQADDPWAARPGSTADDDEERVADQDQAMVEALADLGLYPVEAVDLILAHPPATVRTAIDAARGRPNPRRAVLDHLDKATRAARRAA